MREVDLILGGFADRELATLSDHELAQLEALMEVPDTDLLKWFTGQKPVPDHYDTAVFRRIVASPHTLSR